MVFDCQDYLQSSTARLWSPGKVFDEGLTRWGWNLRGSKPGRQRGGEACPRLAQKGPEFILVTLGT